MNSIGLINQILLNIQCIYLQNIFGLVKNNNINNYINLISYINYIATLYTKCIAVIYNVAKSFGDRNLRIGGFRERRRAHAQVVLGPAVELQPGHGGFVVRLVVDGGGETGELGLGHLPVQNVVLNHEKDVENDGDERQAEFREIREQRDPVV